MNRESVIKGIIEARRSHKDDIAQRMKTLRDVILSLDVLRERGLGVQARKEDAPEVCSKLQALFIKIADAKEKAEHLVQDLARLSARSSRHTLNIGIVGKPKQGKSTFLQALTGLDEATIPTGKDFVTGACSYLRHDESVAPGDAFAVITPYTRQEFWQEVLAPFCQKFPALAMLAPEDLPDLQIPDESTLTETEKFELERLRHLQRDYHSYKNLLGSGSLKIGKREIRKYVAQCDESGAHLYTNWYAIKKAEIHCRFPQSDIGAVAICDTPGLGDFTPGAQVALMEKLSMDMDVVFFLKRPAGKETIEPDDTAFYDVVKAANPLFSVRDWTYMLLNCSANETLSPHFLNSLNEKLKTRLDVKQMDAKRPETVSVVFNEVLEDIVHQIPKLDDKLMDSYRQQLQDVMKTLSDVAATAVEVLPAAGPVAADLEVDGDVDALTDALYAKLTSYQRELREGCLGSLAPELGKTFKHMRENVPALPYSEKDEGQQIKWFAEKKDELRAAFIKEFCNLDETMEKMVACVRGEIQKNLVEYGRMAFICGEQENSNFWEKLKALFLAEIPAGRVEPLVQAIDNLLEFRLSSRAFILPRLTNVTLCLSNGKLPPQFRDFAADQNDSIQTARNRLQTTWSYAVASAEELFDEEEGEMRDINTTPGIALSALIDEFILLWFRSGGEIRAMNLWKSFYRAHAREVWSEKYNSDTSMIALSRQWNAAIEAYSETIKQIH